MNGYEARSPLVFLCHERRIGKDMGASRKARTVNIVAPWFLLLSIGFFSSSCSLLQGGPPRAAVVSIRPHATYFKPSQSYVKDFVDKFVGGGIEVKRTAGHLGMAFSYDFLYEDGDRTDWEKGGAGYDAKARVKLYPLRVTFTYELNSLGPDDTGFNGYIGGGLTVLPWEEEFIMYDASNHKSKDSPTRVTAGGHIVGGLEYYFSPELGIFGEGQWTLLPDRNMLGDKDNFSGYSGQVGVTFKF